LQAPPASALPKVSRGDCSVGFTLLMCACVRACVRECVRAGMYACGGVTFLHLIKSLNTRPLLSIYIVGLENTVENTVNGRYYNRRTFLEIFRQWLCVQSYFPLL